MAQSEYLCLERGLRAKPPEEHPPDQVEQVPHRAFITRFGPSRQADGICDSDRKSALILNITTGPGGRFIPSEHDPKIAAPGTSLMVPEKRVEHISVLRPEICTLDLNTMTFGKQVVINTPPNVRRMAKVIREAGVKPEIE